MEVGGFIAVPPDSVTTIPLEYQLPNNVIRATGPKTFEYRLLVQKQSGMDRDMVSVSVQIPAGTEVTNVSPAPTRRNGRWLGFDFPLEQDTRVVVSYRVP